MEQEFLDSLGPTRIVRLGFCEAVDPFVDVFARLKGGVGDRLIPGLFDHRSSFKAGGGVVGRKFLLEDQAGRHALLEKKFPRNYLLLAPWGLPAKPYLCDRVLELEEIEHDRVGSSPEQEKADALFPLLPSGHRLVDGSLLAVPVDPEGKTIVRVDEKFVPTRFHRNERALPENGESILVHAFEGSVCPEVEIHLAVDSVLFLLVALVHLLDVVVSGPQSSLPLVDDGYA